MLVSSQFPDVHGATQLPALAKPKKRGAPRGPRIPAGGLKAALNKAGRKRPRDQYHDGDQGPGGA